MITEAEARQQALLDGLREDQLTPAVLKLYGYEQPNPVAGVPDQPLYMPDDVKNALTLLDQEAKANALPAQIIGAITKVVGFASKAGLFLVMIVALMTVSGCRSDQAAATTAMIDQSLTSYTMKRDAYDEQLIGYFRASEVERIDRVCDDAMKSLAMPRMVTVKKTIREEIVGADGQPAFREKEVEEIVATSVVEQNAAIALQKQKLRLIQRTEITVLEMRAKLKDIERDAQNAHAMLGGLNAYFAQRVSTLDAIEQAQTGLISFLEKFIADKKTDVESPMKAGSTNSL